MAAAHPGRLAVTAGRDRRTGVGAPGHGRTRDAGPERAGRWPSASEGSASGGAVSGGTASGGAVTGGSASGGSASDRPARRPPVGASPARRPAVAAVRTALLPVAVVASLLPLAPLAGRADLHGSTLPAVAGLVGLAGAILLWWQVVLGVRHVSALLTPDRGAAVALHAWLGSLGAFCVLVHPLLQMYAERRGPEYLVALDLAFAEGVDTTLGRLALLAFLLVWLSSTLARAPLGHRAWRRVHLLSYPLAVLVFLHATAIGTFLLAEPWLRAYWSGLAATFGAVCAYRLLAPLAAARYRVRAAEPGPGGVTRFTLDPPGRALAPRPGQFVGLRTSPLRRAHPFSAVEVGRRGEIVLVVGHVGPFTERLRTLTPGAVVRLDGPHGGFTAGAAAGPAVLVAGGVGVTPFARLAAEHPGAVLVHVNRAEPVLGAELAAACGERYLPVTRSAAPGPGVRPGRFDARTLPAELDDPAARWFVCGSPRFVDGVRADLRAAGVPRRRIRAERFDS